MLNFDTNSRERLNNPKVEIETKLWLISRYIEEVYQLIPQPNYWEDKFGNLELNHRIFYRLWLWLNYAEDENLVEPIDDFSVVYGEEQKEELLHFLNIKDRESRDIEAFYIPNGEAGKILFTWAKKEFDFDLLV